MSADSLRKIQSWVDSAFAVHPDMKGHTGGITSFGLGGLWAGQQSKNQIKKVH